MLVSSDNKKCTDSIRKLQTYSAIGSRTRFSCRFFIRIDDVTVHNTTDIVLDYLMRRKQSKKERNTTTYAPPNPSTLILAIGPNGRKVLVRICSLTDLERPEISRATSEKLAAEAEAEAEAEEEEVIRVWFSQRFSFSICVFVGCGTITQLYCIYSIREPSGIRKRLMR